MPLDNARHPEVPDEAFVRLPFVLRHLPWKKSKWYALLDEGIVPAGVMLGPMTRAWRAGDIRALADVLEILGQGGGPSALDQLRDLVNSRSRSGRHIDFVGLRDELRAELGR